MRSTTVRNWIIVILLVSAVFRIGYLTFGKILPVMWDSRRYASAAVALISYVDHSGPDIFSNEREDRYRFKHYYEKYIQGEQIEWLQYTPHTLTEARDDLYFSGPLYPFFLATIFYLAPTADFTFARIFGILTDLLCNWLIILIGFRLIGRKAALVAGFMYAIYFPFIHSSTMLLLETSTSFLILFAVYCLMRAYESDSKKFYILAGLITGLMIINKPTAMLLVVPIGLGFYFYARRKLPLSVMINRLLYMATPFLLIFICWGTAASVKYGQLALRDPSYSASNLRQSTSIEYEGYDLDKVERNFWTRSVAGDIVNDPVGYSGLLVKKFNRLWVRPYEDSRRDFIIPFDWMRSIHLIIVISGLMGLLLLTMKSFNLAAWPFFIIGYYTAVHLVFHSISRYNFNAMPLVLLVSSFFIVQFWEKYVSGEKRIKHSLQLTLLLIVITGVVDYNWINQVFKTSLSSFVVTGTLIIKSLLVVGALTICGRVFFEKREPLFRTVFIFVGSAVFILSGWTSVLSRDNWSEFQCRLDNEHVKAGNRLFISDLKDVEDDEMIAALVDLTSGAGRKNTFTVTVGDTAMEFVQGESPLLDLFYPKPTYRIYARLIPLELEEFRQYAIVPVPQSLIVRNIEKNGYIDITVSINNRFDEKNNFVDLYGRYAGERKSGYIPSIRFTSIERFVFENDPRIKYHVNFLSDSTFSYYIKTQGNPDDTQRDLSPSPGLQTGRYNMFLVHFKPDGSFLVY